MATLKIFAAAGIEDEERCILALADDDGNDLLKSIKPLTPAVAAATAKVLKFKGPFDGWKIDKESGEAHFEPIADTPFEIFTDRKTVQSALNGADIEWDPPELDPAADVKEQDTTPAKPIDGS